MTSVLVAGANGFIGAHIVRALKTRGITVWGLVRILPVQWRLADLHDVPTLATDVTDTSAVKAAVRDIRPDVVINAASYGVSPDEDDPDRMFDVNVDGAYHLVQACRDAQVKRLVQLGSYWEYGDHAGAVREDTPLQPKTLYGATKAAASLILAAADAGVTETVVLRLFNTWGQGEKAHRLIPSVVRACRAGTPLDLTAGTQVKDYAYAPDLGRWIADVALREQTFPHRIYNVPGKHRISVRDLALAAARALGRPDLLRFGAKPMPENEVQTGPADSTRIDGVLNRDATPLDDAMRQMTA
jgi:nucleoside-diphosphate-sugar epimerase